MSDKTIKSSPNTFTVESPAKVVGSDIVTSLFYFTDTEGRQFNISTAGVFADCSEKEDSYSFPSQPLSSIGSTAYISKEDAAELDAIIRESIAKAEYVNSTPQDVLAAVDAMTDNKNPLKERTFEVKNVSPLEIACKSPRLKALEPKGNKHRD